MIFTVLQNKPTGSQRNPVEIGSEKKAKNSNWTVRSECQRKHMLHEERSSSCIYYFFFPISPLRIKIKGRADPGLRIWTKNKELLRKFSWNCLESIQGPSLHYKIGFKQSTLPYGFQLSAGYKFSFYLPRSWILAIFDASSQRCLYLHILSQIKFKSRKNVTQHSI